MGEKVFSYHFTVAKKHLDVFHHVNNAAYMQIYEEARWAMAQEEGYGLEDLQREQKGPVILRAEIDFRKELQEGQEVLVETFCRAKSDKLYNIHQRMLRGKGEEQQEVSCALFLCGFFDLKTRKLLVVDKRWLQAIGIG